MNSEDIIRRVSPYTLTNPTRMAKLYQAVLRIKELEGDIVETGVYKGGSSMLMAMTLKSQNIKDKKIYMYDTFSGVPEPSAIDNKVHGLCNGIKKYNKKKELNSPWNLASIEEVSENIKKADYPLDKFVLVKGLVEDTIPGTKPEKIALLRLDTDFYTSTKHTLKHLYPLLVNGGYLVIDDYNCWEGCKVAVDEYFKENGLNKHLLEPVDGSCVQYRKGQ